MEQKLQKRSEFRDTLKSNRLFKINEIQFQLHGNDLQVYFSPCIYKHNVLKGGNPAC